MWNVSSGGRVGPSHLAAQSGELAEGDDQVVKHVTEAIMSRDHRTFPTRQHRQGK